MRKKKGTKVLIAILVLVIIAAGGVLGYKIMKDKQNGGEIFTSNEVKENKKEVQIFKRRC